MRPFGSTRLTNGRARATLSRLPSHTVRAGFILFCAMIWVLASPSAGAQTLIADVDASDETTFGRLVFTFRDRTLLPEFTSRVANGILQIDFSEPVEASVSNVPAALKDFISVALQDPAGFGVRFGLRARYRINTMEAGEKLFVDILPRNWRGAPPPLPDDVIKELAERAEAALKRVRDLERSRFGKAKRPKVELRVGRHPTFSRLAFFWNVPFDTIFEREGDIVRLVFSRNADLNLFEVLSEKPPGLVDFDTFEEGDKLKVILQVDDQVDVRGFREADAYVVDIAPQNARPTDTANRQVREALSSDTSPTREAVVSAPAAPPQEAGVPQAEIAEPAPVTTAEPDRGAIAVPAVQSLPAAPPAPAPQSIPDNAAVAAQPPVAEQQPVIEPPSPLPAIPPVAQQEVPAPTPVPDTDALLQVPPREVAIDANGRELAPADRPSSADLSVEGSGDDRLLIGSDLLDVEANRIGNLVRIVFPFSEPTAGAVFKRDDALWLIFDTHREFALDAMHSALKPLTRRIETGNLGLARTVRIDLANPALATVGRDGSSWIINIGDLILEPSKPVTFRRSVRADGGMTLMTTMPNARSVHRLQDPKAGDTIFVVTADAPATGVLKPQRFVEVDALTSAHGIALVARSDGLNVVNDDGEIIVQQPNGLSLSSRNLSSGGALLPRQAGASRPGFLDLDAYYETDPVRLRERRAALFAEVAAAGEDAKNAAWLALARFYLANSFAQEARGVLTLVRRQDAALENDSTFLLMMGIAEILSGHPKQAEQYILQNDLEGSPDADIWRVVLHNASGNWPEARKSAMRARRAIGSYPPTLQAKFNLSAAEAAVELNDFGEASAILAEIDPARIDQINAARYDILRARLADVSDRTEDAITLLNRVIEFGKRPSVAEATYRLLKIERRDDLKDVDEIVDGLRRLSVVWRGDELELKTVRFLAQLLADKGEYREAFKAARQALFVDSDAETSKLLQREMNDVFSGLFIHGKADALEPVEALGLFYDFRELTPIGARGDAIVRNLAERLVDVDLLDQAAELLQHQVDNRLKGAARAQIAADLALIYLLDRKPDHALRALRRTRQAKLPESMERQRRLVEARALVESGRHQAALDMLETLRGPEVERMKADASWAGKRWEETGEHYESLVGARWSLRAPLSEVDRLDVLRSAIGYSLAGNQLALDRLRGKFADKMSETEHAAAFEVVTRPIEASGAEFSAIASQIASIDTLELFLDDYRKRFASSTPAGAAPEASPADTAAPDAQSGGDGTAEPAASGGADPAAPAADTPAQPSADAGNNGSDGAEQAAAEATSDEPRA
ncbi:MAG: tetratricopeptide repeat protein [Pseudomonadota bacterium]